MTIGPRWLLWATAAVLVTGVGFTSQVLDQEMQQLRRPLTQAIPAGLASFVAEDVTLPQDQIEVAGVTDYVMRVYKPQDPTQAGMPAWVSVYVGYYESQTQGNTIHSPKNCMPGSGWEALAARTVEIPTAGSASARVNRYLLVNEGQQVLVLYWYQGRGRVVASEYQAKWDLLRDAALHRRSDEALVRIVVPIVDGDEERAYELAAGMAEQMLPALNEALPSA